MWKVGEPKEIVPGVVAWEKVIDVPDGIIDSMNEEVDIWKEKVASLGDKPGNYYTVTNDNGPVRFDPENDFHRQENKNYLKQVQDNTLNKVAQYFELFPDVKEEIGWFETYQYITYKPPKHMKYHSDNHATRNPATGMMYVTPYLRRITCLTYLNDDFDGGALDFRYWSERGYLPYKPPAGSLVIMPSGFMWSHATTPLLNGRKSAFLVAVSSGTDYDKYLETLDIEQTAQREFM